MDNDGTNELKVINAVLQNKDIDTLYSKSVDELFVAYGDIWQSVKNYYAKYHAVPDIEIIQEKHKDLEKVSVGSQTAPYLDGLREEYIASRVDSIITKAALGMKSGMAPEDVLGKLQVSLSGLNRITAGATDTDIMDFDAAIKHYEEVRERAEQMGGQPGISTGISFIDSAYTTGFAPGDLILMYGWTGRGKSLASTLFACHAFECGFKPMVVSLEMNASKVRDRVFTIMGSGLFKNSSLALGDIPVDSFREFASKRAGKQFIVINNEGANELTPNMVEAKIDQHNPKMVIIDYAQLASDNRNSDNTTQRMMNMSKEYKRLALKKQVVIILISSATAEGVSKQDGPPNIQQVAWSRQLAYDADLAFAVHKYEDSNLVDVVCDKNRNGPLFAGSLEWDIDNGIVKEL